MRDDSSVLGIRHFFVLGLEIDSHFCCGQGIGSRFVLWAVDSQPFVLGVGDQ